tara:strand:- start:387 stop:617 length:231 start_codon:yes stop_codon:yes gene_type:complete
MQVNNYIVFNDRLLKINRTINEHKLKPEFDQQLMKEWSRSDTLLRKDGMLYCCETIQEATIYNPKDDIQLQLDFPE